MVKRNKIQYLALPPPPDSLTVETAKCLKV